jgi:exodeoxyribonuclease VII large subunit
VGGELDLFPESGVSPGDAAWSVAAVTRKSRQLIEVGFKRLWVRGEVANFKVYRSGHWYFTLRDSTAQVRCVMWRDDARKVSPGPEEGLEVFVEARPTVWEERGEFRLHVKGMLPTSSDGVWELQLQRARLALERDGLLNPMRKRLLPRFPMRIAVVTSPDGAAFHDIVSVVRRRWPVAEVYLSPTRVQGDGAELEIVAAMHLAEEIPGVEVLIIGRGGGSREDLWAFNTELVARALAYVSIPTVSAVGHETDTALTDLVADVTAPTPSAAAESVVPDIVHASTAVDELAMRMSRSLTGRTGLGLERLERTADRLSASIHRHVQSRSHQVAQLAGRLDALSPLHVLKRGYAVPRADGRVLRTRSDFTPGLSFQLRVADGDVEAVASGRH